MLDIEDNQSITEESIKAQEAETIEEKSNNKETQPQTPIESKAKLYYLFSKTEHLEALYVCDDGDYIDSPLLQTGVYPMGTILSKAIKILTPWTENNYNLISSENDLSIGFDNFSKKDSSFSNVVCDDSAVRIILKRLMVYDEKRIKFLQSCMDYISLCQERKEHCSIENLILLSNKNNNDLPQRSIYVVDKTNGKNNTSGSYFDLLGKPFAPSLKKQQAHKLFELPQIQTKITPWKTLTTPVYVFGVYDILDFILASLQCVFEQNYILRKCHYCDCENLFITKDKKQTHCPKQDSENNNKSCAEIVKSIQQEEYENRESVKLHKSIRTMLYSKIATSDICADLDNKANFANTKYNDYMKDSQEWRDRIKAGKETEENYVAWLKRQYKHKYK